MTNFLNEASKSKDTLHLPGPCPFLLSPADALKVCP